MLSQPHFHTWISVSQLARDISIAVFTRLQWDNVIIKETRLTHAYNELSEPESKFDYGLLVRTNWKLAHSISESELCLMSVHTAENHWVYQTRAGWSSMQCYYDTESIHPPLPHHRLFGSLPAQLNWDKSSYNATPSTAHLLPYRKTQDASQEPYIEEKLQGTELGHPHSFIIQVTQKFLVLSDYSFHHSSTKMLQGALIQSMATHTTDLLSESEEEGSDIWWRVGGDMDDRWDLSTLRLLLDGYLTPGLTHVRVEKRGERSEKTFKRERERERGQKKNESKWEWQGWRKKLNRIKA